jgi:hypothetical protein
LTRIPDFSTVGDDLNGQAFRFFVNPSISAIFPLFSTHRFLYASGSRHITKTNEPRLEEKNQDGNLFQFQTLAIKVELYERFYRDNKERIFAYLLRLTGDYHLAGDLTQESFTRCLARYGATATIARCCTRSPETPPWMRPASAGRRRWGTTRMPLPAVATRNAG